jgi:hypothetical protein
VVSTLPPSRRLGLTTVYAIWLFGIVSYFVPAATWSPVSRFNIARAVVEEQTFRVDSFAASTGDRARVNDHWYSDKAPIVGLAAAAPYAVYHLFDRLRGGQPRFTAIASRDLPAFHVYVNTSFQRGLYVTSVATAGASGVAVGLLLFMLLRRRTTVKTALFASSVTVLGTPLLPYSTSLYGHSVAAAFLLAGFAAVDGEREGAPLDLSPRRLRVAGACLALAAGSEYIVAIPSTIVGVWLLWASRGHRWRTVRDLALGAAVPVAIVCAYHTVCFGAPWRTPYAFIVRPEFAAGHAKGFYGIQMPKLEAVQGLLFSERRGLFYVAPVTVLGFVGAAIIASKRRDPMIAVMLAAAGSLLLVNAGYYMWWGGAAAGPRHLVPVLAVSAFGLVWMCRQGRALRLGAYLASAVSAANMLAVTAVGLEAPESGDILTRYVYPHLLSGRVAHMNGASNLAIELGLARGASLGPLLAWLVVGFRILMRRADTEESLTTAVRPSHASLLLGGLALVSCVDRPEDKTPLPSITARSVAPAQVVNAPAASPAQAVNAPAASPPKRNLEPNHPELYATSYPNGNLLIGRSRECVVEMLGPGTERWFKRLDGDCGGGIRVAVAPNSQAFARTATELHAFAHDGALLWSVPVEHVPDELAAPAVTPDSSVVTARSPRSVAAFDPEGKEVWTFSIEGAERLAASPVGRPTEGLLIVTNEAAYAIAPDGTVRWRSPFGS